jgi:urease beta subunit
MHLTLQERDKLLTYTVGSHFHFFGVNKAWFSTEPGPVGHAL